MRRMRWSERNAVAKSRRYAELGEKGEALRPSLGTGFLTAAYPVAPDVLEPAPDERVDDGQGDNWQEQAYEERTNHVVPQEVTNSVELCCRLNGIMNCGLDGIVGGHVARIVDLFHCSLFFSYSSKLKEARDVDDKAEYGDPEDCNSTRKARSSSI